MTTTSCRPPRTTPRAIRTCACTSWRPVFATRIRRPRWRSSCSSPAEALATRRRSEAVAMTTMRIDLHQYDELLGLAPPVEVPSSLAAAWRLAGIAWEQPAAHDALVGLAVK